MRNQRLRSSIGDGDGVSPEAHMTTLKISMQKAKKAVRVCRWDNTIFPQTVLALRGSQFVLRAGERYARIVGLRWDPGWDPSWDPRRKT